MVDPAASEPEVLEPLASPTPVEPPPVLRRSTRATLP